MESRRRWIDAIDQNTMKDSSRKFWFRFFWRDWLASPSIAALTLEQEAAYLRLMSFHYDCGSLPNDHAALERMVGKKMSKGAIGVVAALFSPSENDASRLVHQRVLEELAEIDAWIEKSSEGGKKSAEIRAKNRKGASTTLGTVVQPPLEPPLEPNSNQTPTKSQPNAQLKPSQLQLQSQLHEGNVGGPSYVEVKREVLPHGPERTTEPPPGFPRSEEEAIESCKMFAVPAEFASEKYFSAVGLGYRDRSGRVITRWAHYVKGEYVGRENYRAIKQANSPQNGYPAKNGERRDLSKRLPGETKEEYDKRYMRMVMS